MRPYMTIGSYLPKPKDPLNSDEIFGIVYKVPCCDCEFVYIGQSKRDLKSRLSEHIRAIKNQRPDLSALCEHSITLDHKINWDDAKINKSKKIIPKGFLLKIGISTKPLML